jgi:hypothetical protein
MADEVVAGLEAVRDQPRVDLEVDALDGRVGWEAGALKDDELEALRERLLRPPREGAADHAAVHENEPVHPAIVAM